IPFITSSIFSILMLKRIIFPVSYKLILIDLKLIFFNMYKKSEIYFTKQSGEKYKYTRVLLADCLDFEEIKIGVLM
ncbi:hypothetical protein H312_02491, partial [Anncaliia algerae PRA339]